MVKYYDTKKEELTRNYANEVPSEILKKRGHIIYEEVIIDVEDTQELPENTFEVFENKVIETKYNSIHIPTLDELKTNKINALKFNTKIHIESVYNTMTQLNASLGLLDQIEIDKIKDFIQRHRTEVDLIEAKILSYTTKEEIEIEPDTVELEEI